MILLEIWILLVLPSIIGCLPTNTIISQAAESDNVSLGTAYYCMSTWNEDKGEYEYTLTLEVGQTVKMGYLFNVHGSEYILGHAYKRLSDVTGDKYTSSKPKVATVGKTSGKLTAKAKGTTTITVKYKGAKITCKVKVVKKNGFGVAWKKKSKIKSIVNQINKIYTGKITASNQYKLRELLQKLNNYSYNSDEFGLCDGFVYVPYDGTSYDYGTTDKLAIPEWAEADHLNNKITNYIDTNNPLCTDVGVCFKIKSVSSKANSRDFTINLKSKVTSANIFGIQCDRYNGGDEKISKSDRAVFDIILQDTKTGFHYYGRAIVKKGSNKMTVNMNYLKLVKNRKYKIIAADAYYQPSKGWTKGYTFTAK